MSLNNFVKKPFNVPTGSTHKFQVNNVDVVSVTSSGLTVAGASTVGSLTVTGAITRSGVYATSATVTQSISTTTAVAIASKVGSITTFTMGNASTVAHSFTANGPSTLGLTSTSIVIASISYGGTGVPVLRTVPGTDSIVFTITNGGGSALNAVGVITYQIL